MAAQPESMLALSSNLHSQWNVRLGQVLMGDIAPDLCPGSGDT